jgi:5-hydroxyisourate hydrolase
MSSISTHVLDQARGGPARGVPVLLERRSGNSWSQVGGGTTDDDGRVPGLLAEPLAQATYRITFNTGAWFDHEGLTGFYPSASIVFQVRSAQEHHHVPLLLSPYGYSTYRGS